MTTDITELALIAKIKKQTESYDTVILREDEANVLVEALEKAKQHIARQEQILLNQDESLSIRRGELEAAQQEQDNWRTSFDNERFRADKLASVLNDEIEQAANVRGQLLIAHKTLLNQQAKIAELESRTVKMPEPFKLAKSSSGLTYYFADDVDAALTAAGIKWEAE